jgi:hypothetical protein
VRTAPELFAAGRVYYCHHDTPELVWHRPWMSHANGVRGLRELVVVTTDIEADGPRYAKAARAPLERRGEDRAIALAGGFCITLVSPSRYRNRYGELCVEMGDRRSIFGAIVFDTEDARRVRDLASSLSGALVESNKGSVALQLPFLNSMLEFR